MTKTNKYKIIVLDLDGTLTNSKKEISPKTKETLIKAQQEGVIVCLASGRPTYGIASLADELEINKYNGYIVAYNGGKIINYEDKSTIFCKTLPDELIPVIYEHSKKQELCLLAYDGGDVITEDAHHHYIVKDAYLNKMNVREVEDFVSAINKPLCKCLAIGDPDRILALQAELQTLFPSTINAFRSEPYYLEICPSNIDKATSLEKLLEKISLKRTDMIAFGDGFNDLGMIQFAGMGVAMGNAQEAVKEVADYITLTNDEDGVAHLIEKIYWS